MCQSGSQTYVRVLLVCFHTHRLIDSALPVRAFQFDSWWYYKGPSTILLFCATHAHTHTHVEPVVLYISVSWRSCAVGGSSRHFSGWHGSGVSQHRRRAH